MEIHELNVIKQQLEFALNEVQKKRSDKTLIHDWITEALNRVKELNKSEVNNSAKDDMLLLLKECIKDARWRSERWQELSDESDVLSGLETDVDDFIKKHCYNVRR